MRLSRKGKFFKRKRHTRSRKIAKSLKGGSHKQSILIILSTNEMYPEFKPQTVTLKKYIEHLSKTYNVDLAGISSKDDFSNYEDTLVFKYKYVNAKAQVSKICDFISENRDKLNYDWYFRTRPEEELLDFDCINFETLPKDAVSARAREYIGPFTGKYSCSVGGEGAYKDIKACFYKTELEKLVLDSNDYVFHKTVVEKGGFAKITQEEKDWEKSTGRNNEDEWFFDNIMVSRNIKKNIIDIELKFTRKSRNQVCYSGGINTV